MLPLLYGRFSIISFHGLGDPPTCASAFPVGGDFCHVFGPVWEWGCRGTLCSDGPPDS